MATTDKVVRLIARIPRDNGLLPWWADPAIWADDDRHERPVERQAIARLRLQSHHYQQTEKQVMREVLAEERAARLARRDRPLREILAARGETVATINGQRVTVPARVAA